MTLLMGLAAGVYLVPESGLITTDDAALNVLRQFLCWHRLEGKLYRPV